MKRNIIILALAIVAVALPGTAMAAAYGVGPAIGDNLTAVMPDPAVCAMLLAGFAMTVVGLRRRDANLRTA